MTDWSTLKKLIWLRIIKGGGSALRTVTGAIVHVTNALAMPAKALTVNVEPIQDLHGYDSPWPAGGGKNLLNPGDNATQSGVTKTVNADGTITFTGTATGVTDLYFNGTTPSFTACPLPNGTYHIEGPEGGSASTYDFFWIYQKDGTTKYANGRDHTPVTVDGEIPSRIFFRVYSGYTINLTVKLGLFEGAYQANTWTPYSNICPISGRTSATVTRTGVNIWDEQWELGGIIIATGQPYNAADRIRSKNFCTCKPNTRYFVKAPSNFLSIFWYDANKIYLSRLNVTPNMVVTFPDSAYFFKIVLTNATTYGNDISINYPETASAYEPYAGNTYTITFPTEAGTVYKGSTEIVGGDLTADAGFLAVTGSDDENWAYSSGWSKTNTAVFYGAVRSDVSYADKIDAIYACDTFVHYARDTLYSSDVPGICFSGTSGASYVTVRVPKTIASDLQTFKTWLSNNNISIVYKKKTTSTYALTPTPVNILLGENNLWSDAGDSTLTYYAEGEASTSEALGILLGGTYNNPGGADDVSDDEALGILLGGS